MLLNLLRCRCELVADTDERKMLRAALSLRCAAAPVSTMSLIRDLRFKTDAPIVECKKALVANGNDIEKAIAWLKEKGAAGSVKKQGRDTAYGAMATCMSPKGAAILQVCSETDFAARNTIFAGYARALSAELQASVEATDGAVLDRPMADVVAEVAAAKVTETAECVRVLGENVRLSNAYVMPLPAHELPLPKFTTNEAPAFLLGQYVHNAIGDGEGVGSIVGIAGVWSYGGDAAMTQADVNDLAQHVVAHLGDKSDLVHQAFLGSGETVGQWLKARHAKLRSAAAMKFGDDQPLVRIPRSGPPPQHQGKKKE
jgi:elongation factor Ts